MKKIKGLKDIAKILLLVGVDGTVYKGKFGLGGVWDGIYEGKFDKSPTNMTNNAGHTNCTDIFLFNHELHEFNENILSVFICGIRGRKYKI